MEECLSKIENALANQKPINPIGMIIEEKVSLEQKKDAVQEGDILGVEDL